MPRFTIALGLMFLAGCATDRPLAGHAFSNARRQNVAETGGHHVDPLDRLSTASRAESKSSESPGLVRQVAHEETDTSSVPSPGIKETPPLPQADDFMLEMESQNERGDLFALHNSKTPERRLHSPLGRVEPPAKTGFGCVAAVPRTAAQAVALPARSSRPSQGEGEIKLVRYVETNAQGEVKAVHGTDMSYAAGENSVELNLPSALAMIDAQHPAVGLAQWRVREAYAQLAQTKVLWLPSIQAGFSFHRHDGNYQASDGTIVEVNRNSFQYGLGTGGTGAGTTPRPGLVARFHLADAIFQPELAKKMVWARGHAAKAVVNLQLLNAAVAYLDLLDAHQDARILDESRERTSQLSKITSDFAAAGEGLQADADRMLTELNLADNRLIGARERISVASARLAQALSLDGGQEILPMDVTTVPLELVSRPADAPSLIATGLATRPELKESQALVAAACEAYRREKFAPFVPSVLLGFSTGGFGGGLGNNSNNIDSRYDFDALMSWEVRNLGLAERALRQEACARIQQAKFESIRVMDQVAREVSEAYSQIQSRASQMAVTQRAIHTAQTSYDLNLARIRDGQGLPLEVLQSVQSLDSARRAYLRAVVEHNQAQFRLQWALGWPVAAPG